MNAISPSVCMCVSVCADMRACGGGQRLMSHTVLGCSSLYSLWTPASHFSRTAWPRISISAFPALGLAVAPAHPPGIHRDLRDLKSFIRYTAFITVSSPQSISGILGEKMQNQKANRSLDYPRNREQLFDSLIKCHKVNMSFTVLYK